MATIDLNGLSIKELKDLQKEVDRAITNFADREKAETRAQLEAFAKERGFTLAELLSGKVKKARAPVQAKYKHPENPDLTWSGRGRKPLWFVDALAAGQSPDDLAIR